jgi:hypothetical protein
MHKEKKVVAYANYIPIRFYGIDATAIEHGTGVPAKGEKRLKANYIPSVYLGANALEESNEGVSVFASRIPIQYYGANALEEKEKGISVFANYIPIQFYGFNAIEDDLYYSHAEGRGRAEVACNIKFPPPRFGNRVKYYRDCVAQKMKEYAAEKEPTEPTDTENDDFGDDDNGNGGGKTGWVKWAVIGGGVLLAGGLTVWAIRSLR